MKTDLHEQTRVWLLSGKPLASADQDLLQKHLDSCSDCRQLALQANHLAERLPAEADAPVFSPPFSSRNPPLFELNLKGDV